ncbi:MAG: ChaN family lipoprotein [Verrucomicrobiota bacterium]
MTNLLPRGLPLLALALAWLATSPPAAAQAKPFWLDLYTGEEVPFAKMVEDLAAVDVVYAGEIHTIARHHRYQTELLRALAAKGKPMALGLEQIEARHQPIVDRFNSGELDFDGLARELEWGKSWRNFEQYRPLCELAQKNGIPVRALNAPNEIIRAVGRKGLASLSPEQRRQLPAEIELNDPLYEKLMNLLLAVHMTMDPNKLQTVFEAQVARDETMAEHIAEAARGADGQPRQVFVVCGRGHVSYGLGIPDRVQRRLSQSTARIILATESGELELTEQEQAMQRDITVTHADLRSLRRPLADYLQVLPRSGQANGQDGE